MYLVPRPTQEIIVNIGVKLLVFCSILNNINIKTLCTIHVSVDVKH